MPTSTTIVPTGASTQIRVERRTYAPWGVFGPTYSMPGKVHDLSLPAGYHRTTFGIKYSMPDTAPAKRKNSYWGLVIPAVNLLNPLRQFHCLWLLGYMLLLGFACYALYTYWNSRNWQVAQPRAHLQSALIRAAKSCSRSGLWFTQIIAMMLGSFYLIDSNLFYFDNLLRMLGSMLVLLYIVITLLAAIALMIVKDCDIPSE